MSAVVGAGSGRRAFRVEVETTRVRWRVRFVEEFTISSASSSPSSASLAAFVALHLSLILFLTLAAPMGIKPNNFVFSGPKEAAAFVLKTVQLSGLRNFAARSES